jgi:hypothetical protein
LYDRVVGLEFMYCLMRLTGDDPDVKSHSILLFLLLTFRLLLPTARYRVEWLSFVGRNLFL